MIVGSRRMPANTRNASLRSIAGDQASCLPGGTLLITPACPPTITPSPISILSDTADLPTQNNAVAELTTAGYTGLACYQAALADYDVMGNLNEVVNFCAGADSRLAEFCPVNAAIGAYLDKVLDNNNAVVRDEPMSAVNERIAKAGGADCGVGLNDNIIAD